MLLFIVKNQAVILILGHFGTAVKGRCCTVGVVGAHPAQVDLSGEEKVAVQAVFILSAVPSQGEVGRVLPISLQDETTEYCCFG